MRTMATNAAVAAIVAPQCRYMVVATGTQSIREIILLIREMRRSLAVKSSERLCY